MKSPTPLSRISAIPPPSPFNTVSNTPPLPLQYQYRQQGDRSGHHIPINSRYPTKLVLSLLEHLSGVTRPSPHQNGTARQVKGPCSEDTCKIAREHVEKLMFQATDEFTTPSLEKLWQQRRQVLGRVYVFMFIMCVCVCDAVCRSSSTPSPPSLPHSVCVCARACVCLPPFLTLSVCVRARASVCV